MRVLAVSVHPDDETLGAGGTLLRHRAQGDELHWCVVTSAHEPQWSQETIDAKAREVDRVADAYGMTSVRRLGLPAAHLETIPANDVIHRLAEVVEAVRPEVVYTVHPGDVNTDHAAGFAGLLAVLKPFHMARHGVRRVLAWETLSSTEAAARPSFTPTVFCDVTATIDRKLEIMALYESEAQPEPLPRSPSAIRALARLRGATIAVEYAEAFVLVREAIGRDDRIAG